MKGIMNKEETKVCQNCKEEFNIEPEDFEFYEKIKVPAPTWCPLCRYKRRNIWRNVRHLFRGQEADTGKEIFMQVSPGVGLSVYELERWRGDSWDSLEYGKEYDFSRSFFEQLYELFKQVPFPALAVIGNNKGSEYCNQIDYPKNCYLVFDASNPEDSAYSVNVGEIKNCFDMAVCFSDELCYDCTRTDKSYHVIGSLQCEACNDVWFSKNCVGCSNCFGCVNLRHQKYKILNKQYTKEEYKEKIAELKLNTWSGYSKAKKQAETFWTKFPIKFMLGVRNKDVSGEDIKDSKNVKESYTVHKSENLKYAQNIPMGASNSYDYSVWGESATRMYECMTCGMQTSDIKFSFDVWPSSLNVEYGIVCRRIRDCFGCVGVKDKQYCILNEQYTKEEYEELLPKIKQHMNNMPYTDKLGRVYAYGEFFPPELSPFAYNETLLNDQFPSTKEEVKKEGFSWREPNRRVYETTLNTSDLADDIADVGDSILTELIACESCKKAYRIIKMELDFMRQMNLPLPRTCIDCRFAERQKFIPPPRFYKRKCQCAGEQSDNGIYKNTIEHSHHGKDHCSNEFETSYAPDRSEIVYCDKCYQGEVV